MDKPIGVFDSGIGGLTVVRQIINVLPKESLVYIGDTARVPYGNRDEETIKKFSRELVQFLSKKDVKAIVVACNTISAVALREVERLVSVPLINVISPTVSYVSQNFKGKRIGLIATRATLASHAYENQFAEKGVQIESKAAPLFVPLIEEGLLIGKAPEVIVKMYLDDFNQDVLILGSTHYPLLKQTIRKVLGDKTELVDTGYPAALELKKVLRENGLLSESKARYEFFVTDETKRTEEIAKLFFENELPTKLQRVKL